MDDAEVRRRVEAEERRRAQRIARTDRRTAEERDERIERVAEMFDRYTYVSVDPWWAERLAESPYSLEHLRRAIDLRFSAGGPRRFQTVDSVLDLAEALVVSDHLADLRARARMGEGEASAELELVRRRLRES